MKKHVLVVSYVHEGGEWIATSRLITAIAVQSDSPKFSLIGLVDNYNPGYVPEYFAQRYIQNSHAKPPFRYLKKMVLDILHTVDAIKSIISRYSDIDCLLCTNYLMVICCLMVPRRERRPILYFFHGIKSFPFSSLRDINYMDIIIKFLERAALLCSKVIVVPSKTTIPYIQSILPILGKFKQYRIVHNIIPDIFFIQSNKILIKKFKDENGIPYNNKIILYSGRITERKGLLSLLNAFHLLLNITSNVTLIYAYPETSVDQKLLCKLTIRSNELGVAHNLKFFKNLPENKLCFLYKIADITILPSDIEVAPLSMLESLASGSIFLGSDTGNIPDILSRINPLLMLHDTSSQVIYSKLYYFLNVSRQNIKKIQKKSIIIAHKYSSLKSVIELNRIFRRL